MSEPRPSARRQRACRRCRCFFAPRGHEFLCRSCRGCESCGGYPLVTPKRCIDCMRDERAELDARERPLVDATTRYEDDVAAQLFVDAFPGGATLEEVGEALGVTRERVRQIEELALRRAKKRAELMGLSIADVLGKPVHPLAGNGGDE